MKNSLSLSLRKLILLVLTSSFLIGLIQASAVTQLLSSKLTKYIQQFNPLQSSYTGKLAKSAENRGDEYGYGHSGGSSVYVHVPGDGDYGNSKGYGQGGGHQSHHGAITLDPVSIISLLALGAFLINNILQLLRANQASGRSLDVSDINIPLDLSDVHLDKASPFGTEQSRVLDEDESSGSPSFSKFFANVGSLYYLQPKKRNICIKKVVCNYINAQQSREDSSGSFKTKIFDFMLSTITRFVAPEISEQSTNGHGMCQKYNKHCSDAILHDAKISAENKVYSTVTTFVSNFAIQRLMSG